MSEPVTNRDIEDVLSSIRRLVTEEGRAPANRPDPAPQTPPTRLVLTQALRVAETDDAAPVSEDTAPETAAAADQQPFELKREFSAPDGPDEIKFIRSRIMARRPDVEWDDSTDENQPSPNPPWSDPDATLHDAAARAGDTPAMDEPEATSDDDVGDDWQPEIAEDEAAEDADPSQAEPEQRHGADEPDADLPDAEDDPEEDFSQPDLPDVAEAAEPGEMPSADPESRPDTPAKPLSDSGDQSDTAENAHDGRAAILSTKIKALEAAIAQTQDQWEPDGASDDDYAGTSVRTIQWEDADHRADPEPARPETIDAASIADEDAEPSPLDDAILDEDSLRELVADIVRQELQGALGERITRNVRKLVRREIHRALTTQDLE